MNIYTHNKPVNYEVTNVRMIVSNATAKELGLDDEWFAIDSEEAEMMAELSGKPYPELEGHDLLYVEHQNGQRVEKWGRL